jgi:glycosyltransferase involved in cell wall biosynthesis
MKHILFLSRGGSTGGSQKQLEYLAEDLAQDYAPIVVCNSKAPFLNALHAKGIETRVLQLRPWRKLRTALVRHMDCGHLIRFARTNRIDLIHCSNLWLSSYSLRAARELDVPAVLHVRTPVTPREVRKHRLTEATALVAISRRVRRNLVDAGVAAERITVINDAVDLEAFHSSLPESNVLRRDFPHSGRYLIGLAAHIRPAKGQLEFLQSAAHLCRTWHGKATFFLIGEVHSQTYLAELQKFIADNSLSDQVVFTGNRNDMPEVLQALDIVVSVSGGSIMFEGMACGKCVVSAGFTPSEDAVHLRDGETGILLESNQPKVLASTLRTLLKDPQLRESLGRRARSWVEEKLGRHQMADAVRQLYADLLYPPPQARGTVLSAWDSRKGAGNSTPISQGSMFKDTHL